MAAAALPIGLQLFTVRDALAQDVEATVRKVADMGYAGVEPFGLDPDTAPAMRDLCAQLGLAVPSVHVPMPIGDRRAEVVDTVLALGTNRMIAGFGRAEFQDLDSVLRCCERFNEAHELAASHGLRFGIHNHWWEYSQVEGRYPYQVMLAELHPDIFFELDIYWVKTGGVDPSLALAEFGDRTPFLHVKDGPARQDVPMTAVGKGTLDIPGILAANQAHGEWLIVEIDNCATDMWTAVEESLDYLIDTGYGTGTAHAS